MSNILSATIKITSPGLKQTTDQAAEGITKVGTAAAGTATQLTKLQSQVTSFGGGVRTFVTQFKGIPQGLSAIQPAAASAKRGLDQFKQASNQSTQSLVNLSRVVQDAPFGFIGIANNLNPLLESFQRLKATTGTTGGALKALGSALTGPAGVGIALSVVSSLLVVFGDTLFGAAAASKASEEALKSYSDAIEDVQGKVEDLSTEIQFLNKIGSINIKIAGLGEVLDLQGQSVSNAQLVSGLKDERDKLKKLETEITANTELNGEDRVTALKKNADEVDKINKQIVDGENTQRVLYRQIALQRVEDQKEADDKAKQHRDKTVSETIAKAKELADFLDKTTIREFSFEVDPRDSLGETFKRAKEFLERVQNDFRSFKVKSQIKVEAGIDVTKTADYFSKLAEEGAKIREDLQKEINRLTATNPVLIQVQAAREKDKARGAEFFDALGIKAEGVNAPVSLLTDTQKEIVNTASLLNNTLTPAFEGLFQSILAGGNPLKGFFNSLIQSVSELIQKLISAAIQALILSAITGGKTTFLTAFKSIAGFRASGGPVESGKSYIVGERGPELFTPNTGGAITSNSALGNFGGINGGMSVNVTGSSIIRGSDLLILLGNAGRTQRALG